MKGSFIYPTGVALVMLTCQTCKTSLENVYPSSPIEWTMRAKDWTILWDPEAPGGMRPNPNKSYSYVPPIGGICPRCNPTPSPDFLWKYGELPEALSVPENTQILFFSKHYKGILIPFEDAFNSLRWCSPNGIPVGFNPTGWWAFIHD